MPSGKIPRFRTGTSLIPDPRGVIHYNYGNTLSALSRYREAVKQYLIATERDPQDARIWKNLATAYHELGQHKKEMECFDLALKIDPSLPQALVSKGISMLTDFNNPSESIIIINTALEKNPECSIRFPQVWFFLAEAHRRLGDYEQSQEIISKGLLHSPGQGNLRDLQYKIYSEWWRSDLGAAEVAVHFFRERLAREALDYSARSELAAIYESTERCRDAWEILEGAFSALGVSKSVRLYETGFSLAYCSSALGQISHYLAFRNKYPIERFWPSEGELGPPRGHGFEDRLFSSLAVVFCMVLTELSSLIPKSASKSKVRKIAQKFSKDIVRSTSGASTSFATSGWISNELDQQELAGRFARAIIFSNSVAFSEAIHQWGWITGILLIPDQFKEPGVKILANLWVRSEAAASALIEINKVARVLPDEEPSGA